MVGGVQAGALTEKRMNRGEKRKMKKNETKHDTRISKKVSVALLARGTSWVTWYVGE